MLFAKRLMEWKRTHFFFRIPLQFRRPIAPLALHGYAHIVASLIMGNFGKVGVAHATCIRFRARFLNAIV